MSGRNTVMLARAIVVVGYSVCAALGLAESVPSKAVGVVSHIKVISDKVEDVSSLADWKKSCIKDGMSDQEKAIAIWQTVVKYRHQTDPPNEYLQLENNVHDVMKTIHVYGYGQCCCASSNLEQLGRYAGLKARGLIIHAHSVAELYYGDSWHLFDPSLINYFRKPDGSVASVKEIIQAVKEWHKQNPGYSHNDPKLSTLARNGGWKKGPALLNTPEFYDQNGVGAAGWHGWHSTMQEYDCQPDQLYEYGYSQGYQLNVQLRPGERLTRNWFNKGLQVNMHGGPTPGCLKNRAGMGYQKKLGDIAPGRVGNGVHEYDVPLANGAFRTGALVAENLASQSEDQKGPAIHVKDPNAPGVLVIRMPSSYVYLTGKLAIKPVVGDGGRIVISLSENNGLNWRELARLAGNTAQTLDFSPYVFRRYDYRLKFELSGAGTGLDALKITHDVQHSQAPLPALGPGKNTITFSAGPAEGTITIEGRTVPTNERTQLLLTDFQPEFAGLQPAMLRVADYGPTGGMVTFPVSTPGDMTRLRFGAHWRARAAGEGWDLLVSFDEGKTFKKAGEMRGPMKGSCTYVSFGDVPPGTRKALVRYQSTRQRNTLCLFNLRIDADYAEPCGGFRPVKTTYVWEENGEQKRHEHVAKRPNETYEITCAGTPVMKSLTVELGE